MAEKINLWSNLSYIHGYLMTVFDCWVYLKPEFGGL